MSNPRDYKLLGIVQAVEGVGEPPHSWVLKLRQVFEIHPQCWLFRVLVLHLLQWKNYGLLQRLDHPVLFVADARYRKFSDQC